MTNYYNTLCILGEPNSALNTIGTNVQNYTQATSWLNTSVVDGIVMACPRTNSGQLGNIYAYANVSAPPANQSQITIQSTNMLDTSLVNWMILPGTPGNTSIPTITTVVCPRSYSLTPGSATVGTATMNGSGSVTINTNQVSSGNLLFYSNYTGTDFSRVGNLWVSAVSGGSSFTISSTASNANNVIAWYIINVPQVDYPAITLNNIGIQRGARDPSPGTAVTYGKGQLSAGRVRINNDFVTNNSIVLVSTITPDSNPSNQGFLMINPNGGAKTLDFASTNSNDTQHFCWWMVVA